MRKKETLIDYKKDKKGRSFGGPVAKIPCSHCRGPDSNPSQGTRGHILELRDQMPQSKILYTSRKMENPRAATKTPHSQINK